MGIRRWVNCLLLREVPFLLSIRLWDTYLAEGPRMKDFLKYVLAAFLLYWSSHLSSMDFQVPPPPGSSHHTTCMEQGHALSAGARAVEARRCCFIKQDFTHNASRLAWSGGI